MNKKIKTKQEHYVKRFIELPINIIGNKEIEYAKKYIKELEENSRILVEQVEDWSDAAFNYSEEIIRLKEQYCERTDCGGRLGNSKKVEKLENTIKELRNWLEGMLDDEKDIFSVIRVKDVLDKLSELEGIKYEKV